MIKRRSQFYRSVGDGKVQCVLCERRCVIPPGSFGFCKARFNENGELYTLTYGNVSAVESRPIEIKPFYHYWPGSTSLTFSTWSCNFTCPWCQNYHLSRRYPSIEDSYTPPEILIKRALRSGDEGLCVSFQEPTLMTEFAIDVFKLGLKHGLYACYVSNGYITKEALNALIESGLTGFKVDVKGGPEVYEKYCGGLDVWRVWDNVRYALSKGVHVEIVNLVVTGVNEGDIDWIIENHLKYAGSETPLHFTRYYPAYKFYNPPTKVEVLEEAVKKALRSGVHYVYIGNVPAHMYEHTYCPNCREPVIKRHSYEVISYKLSEDNRCPKCGYRVKIVGKYIRKPTSFIRIL